MLKIDRITIYRVAMPLVYPFRTAFGNDDCIESVLVKLQCGNVSGWGEAAPCATPAIPANGPSEFLLIRERLAPLILGQTIETGDELQRRLSAFKDNYFAKGAIDLAWWDLHARTRGEPLWKTIGGKGPVATVGADIGIMDSIDELLAEIAQAVEAGYKRVKLKYRPGWEIDMLSAVRAAFPKVVFHVDCNSAYTLQDLPMLRRLDEFDLAMIEQPLMHDDLLDHAKLARELRTPICLDESITSIYKARQAIEAGACRWINIKHGRVGGFTNALKIHDLAKAASIGCWVGGMLESTIGQSFAIALGTLPNILYPSDIFPTSRFYPQDAAGHRLSLCAPSSIAAIDGPGIGFTPNEQELSAYIIEQHTLENR